VQVDTKQKENKTVEPAKPKSTEKVNPK